MYQEHRPCEALGSAVACYWTLQSDGAAHRVLPDGCMDILLRRPLPPPGKTSPSAEGWRAEVVGTMTRAIVADAAPQEYIGVRFRPGEAFRFLDIAAREATDRSFPLAASWGSVAAELEERLGASPDDKARVVALDGVLARRLAHARPADLRLRRAVRALADGSPAVEAVAAGVGVGPRQLLRLFEEKVGVGPKVVARVFRLRRAVDLLRASPPLSWASVASAAGYFDQAHLVREFHALVGVRPSTFVAARDASDGAAPRTGTAAMTRP